jgi:type I restriction enzyme, S subunit
MSIYPLKPLTEMADVFDSLREPVNASERSKRHGKYPYYGATGQVGWIDDYRQDGTYVLLGEDGAPFFDKTKAKAYLVNGKCWVNNHAHVLKGKDGVCIDAFLCHALNWADYKDAVSGSTRLKLPQNTMNLVLLPAPEPTIQQTIADQLTESFRHVAVAQNAIGEQLNDIKALSNSIVSYSLVSSSPSVMPIGQALDEVTQGVGPSWSQHRVLGATRSGLAIAKERPGKHADRYKPVTAGTVFYNPMRILIGSIAFVDDDDEPGITSPDYVVLRGKPGVVDSRWFYYWLRSPLGERRIQSLARGAVRERMLFNRLAEGEIELPDYDTQVKASKALAQIKPMRTAIRKQSDELELLPQKLLAQVFES